MDNLRKLLVLATNDLLERGLLSLDGKGVDQSDDRGHVSTELAGEPAIVMWQDAGFEEDRISVWWKYDHAQHPQANLEGNSREEFLTASPLAKSAAYPKFVGVVASAWLERKKGKYLQGKGRNHLFEIYVRRGEKGVLDAIPNPVPHGFQAEGRFHI